MLFERADCNCSCALSLFPESVSRLLHPILGVIVRPAWETIAEPTLP